MSQPKKGWLISYKELSLNNVLTKELSLYYKNVIALSCN